MVKVFGWLAAMLILAMPAGDSHGDSGSLLRQVIISSDDAGMCPAVNEGTVLCLSSGWVKSVSIMACGPAFEEFTRFAAAHPEYDYGVHLTLTCEMPEQPWGPVLSSSEVPSLVTPQGTFPPWPQDVAKSAKIEEVEAELKEQIRKTLRAGVPVSHLDHHMFVLFARPDLLELYVRLGREFHLPLRFESKPPLSLLEPYGKEVIEAYQHQARQIEKTGMPILDYIEYANYAEEPKAKREYHLNSLRNLKPGTTEIVIHCSTESGSGVNPPHLQRRVADRLFFSSTEAVQELSEHNIKVIDWREFSRTDQRPTRKMAME